MTNIDYREFLTVETDDVSYDVGFHPAWNKLRLNVERHDWDGICGTELWLAPADARDLALALLHAANQFQVLAHD